MSYLRYLCLYTYSGVCVLVVYFLFVFVLCLVCPMLLVSLDCPFLIAASVFFNAYLKAPAYGVSIYQLIRFSRTYGFFQDSLDSRLLLVGFYDRHHDLNSCNG